MIVTALDDLVVEVENPVERTVGSGFLVGGAVVLTAAHNVGDGEMRVRTRGSDWKATVRLRGDEEVADLALLEITSAAVAARCWRYGEVDRNVRDVVERCIAIGFPYFKEHGPELALKRFSAEVRGEIPTAENIGQPLLTLQVRHTPEALQDKDESVWSGMSGAVVFSDDVIVGVVSEHHCPEGVSSLTVVPITAIDLLPGAENWWHLLESDRSDLVRLPVPPMRDDGLYVWTGADSHRGMEFTADPADVEPIEPGERVDVALLREGRLPNLQRDFRHLGSVFDRWLTQGPQATRGKQKLRVLWIVGEAGIDRSRALLACLSRASPQERAVYDADRDLDLLGKTLSRCLLTRSFALPPLISVDLKSNQDARVWGPAETAVTNAAKQFSMPQGQHMLGDDPYPRIIVAGTIEQEAAAVEMLYGLVEIKSVDIRGRDHQRYYSLVVGQPLSDKHVFNRGLPITTRKLFDRQRELTTVRRAWESEQIRVLSIVAYGGTGKSALVNAWLHEMQESKYKGAYKVLAWSFYSQGTKENLVSADLFVNDARSWLGDDDSEVIQSLWARGQRLASLIKQHKFLLVLDGMEPLQHPLQAPHVGGQLTDDSIRALLEELAKPDWDGLCLVTTRVPLTDLDRFRDENGESAGSPIEQLDLENLNDRDGADLLQHLIGTEADFRDLQEAVREVDGHALAITLLGNYLRDVHGGDLNGRFDIDRLTVDVSEGGHARRIMASYSQWLARNERFAELTILHLIGLFDRPAEPEAMAALLSDTSMTPFIGQLVPGTDAWSSSVGALRKMGLLNREFPGLPGTLDAHPLVREHFRDELWKEYRDWWLQGNRLLFGYYRQLAPPQPTNPTDMNKLYAAVTHGCAAGLHQQIFDEVLLTQVWRDRRTSFSTRRLGMTGADLAALSNYFYPQQWTELRTPSLTPRARVLILTNAGVRLRQLGRLVDARDTFGAVVREIDPQRATPEELEDASYAAAQGCELLVIAGRLQNGDDAESALFNGERAVEYADQGSDAYFKMHSRSSLAEVYFMLNDLERADSLFEEAMAIEREYQPKPPFLYSQSLFRYGYFLIETNRAERILSDESQDPLWGTNGNDSSLLSEAIRLLILGAAHRALIEEGNRAPTFLEAAEKTLDDAIGSFQRAGYADYTVRGLLERAHFFRARHDTRYYKNILEDLGRAAVEARRGQMDLLYTDILMQQVACYLDVLPVMTDSGRRASIKNKIKDDLDAAGRLVAKIGYARRQATLAKLKEAARDAGALALSITAWRWRKSSGRWGTARSASHITDQERADRLALADQVDALARPNRRR